MTERTCGNCRWWLKRSQTDQYGQCHRHPPIYTQIAYLRPETEPDATCGEWADASTTPEQDERRELVRRFAVAIADGISRHTPKLDADGVAEHIWRLSCKLADAEPDLVTKQIS